MSSLGLPYDKRVSKMNRRCSFVGSTNDGDFLTDRQNVRWLCFKVSNINFAYHNPETGKGDFNINDIWAEAYHLYKEGFNYTISYEELQKNEEINQQFKAISLEEELIRRYLEPSNKVDPDALFMTATDVADTVMSVIPNAMVNKFNPRFIGKVLISMGYERTMSRVNATPRYGYWVKKTPEYLEEKLGLKRAEKEADNLPF